MQKKKKIEDCFIKEMKVSYHDLSVGLEVDGNAMTTFDRVERRVSESLYKMMLNSVLGFSGEMQQEMAENYLEFLDSQVINFTGCKGVDLVLAETYVFIGMELDIVKPVVIDDWLNSF
jgi:hypothetical protein